MSRPLDDLQSLLAELIAEHRRLLTETRRHESAVAAMNAAGMEESRRAQETLRASIAGLDARRRSLTDQLAAGRRGVTLTLLADIHPAARTRLLSQRDELRSLIGQIKQRTHVTGRVAGAMLGHLNSVVRLLAGAMQQAGVYTKQGVPKLSARIGGLEALG